MTIVIDLAEVSKMTLDPEALDAAIDAATDAFVAGGEDQEQLVAAIKAYLAVAGKEPTP